MPKLQTVDQFAEFMDVGVNTVRKWVDEGLLPCVRVGYVIRIDPKEALRALKAYRNPVRGKETNAEKQFHKSQAVNGTTVSVKEEAAA